MTLKLALLSILTVFLSLMTMGLVFVVAQRLAG